MSKLRHDEITTGPQTAGQHSPRIVVAFTPPLMREIRRTAREKRCSVATVVRSYARHAIRSNSFDIEEYLSK